MDGDIIPGLTMNRTLNSRTKLLCQMKQPPLHNWMGSRILCGQKLMSIINFYLMGENVSRLPQFKNMEESLTAGYSASSAVRLLVGSHDVPED